MEALRKILCQWFGYCTSNYNKHDDPIFMRYKEIDRRVDRLWKPRDLLDIR
jgi:hypothetical protein